MEKDGFGLLSIMLESHFDVLHLEATKGLKNLSETGEHQCHPKTTTWLTPKLESHRAALLRAGMLEPLVSLITRAESDKLQQATLHLLLCLVADGECVLASESPSN